MHCQTLVRIATLLFVSLTCVSSQCNDVSRVEQCNNVDFTPSQRQCSSANFDLVFLLDCSGSIRDSNVPGAPDNFELLRRIIIEIVDGVQISTSPSEGINVGIVSYATRGMIDLELTGDEAAIRRRITCLPYRGGHTNTSGGLWQSKNVLSCDSTNRPDVQDVVLVITDGIATLDIDRVVPYARELQESGVEMLAIGITRDVEEDRIKELASPNRDGERVIGEDYWLVQDYQELALAVSDITDALCSIERPTPCTEAEFDIVFVLDSSGSIRDTNPDGISLETAQDNYYILKSLISTIVDYVQITTSPDRGVQAGIVSFANRGKVELYITGNEQEINGTIDALRYYGGNTNTSGGLWKTRTVFEHRNNRHNFADVILVITDGMATVDIDRTEPYALELQNEGILMFAVGITDRASEERVRVLSSPGLNGQRAENETYWLLPDYDDIPRVATRIIDVICSRLRGVIPPPAIDWCTPSPCLNNGRCISESNSYSCVCPIGYYGNVCQNDYCNPDSCENGGTCVRLIDGFSCSCLNGFRGVYCQISPSTYCDPNPCVNGGGCVSRPNTYECVCLLGFGGSICQIDFCSPSPCLNSGVCTRVDGGASCQCFDPFYGDYCQLNRGIVVDPIDPNFCDPNPCFNSGTCLVSQSDNTYSCSCLPGFGGNLCQLDYCNPSPCLYNGICIRQVDGYECVCTLPYFGEQCEFIIVDYCNPNQCLNGGECVSSETNFDCICEPGYSGILCHIDACNPNPCLNGGTCQRTTSGAVCQCPPPYFGDNCQEADLTTVAVAPTAGQQQSDPNTDEGCNTACVIALGVLLPLLALGVLAFLLWFCCFYKKKKKEKKKKIKPMATQTDKADKPKSTQVSSKRQKQYEVKIIQKCNICKRPTSQCICCEICGRPGCNGHHYEQNHRHIYIHHTDPHCQAYPECDLQYGYTGHQQVIPPSPKPVVLAYSSLPNTGKGRKDRRRERGHKTNRRVTPDLYSVSLPSSSDS